MAAVPNAPGVPALLTGFDAALSTGLIALTADTVTGLGIARPSLWGIFRGGSPVVTADTVVDLTYKQEWLISDYPLEAGAFESYDKVALPYDVRIRFVAGGSEANRAALLASVQAIAGDMNLYSAVTPEAVYTSCNVRHYDYRRSVQRGLAVLAVDLWLQWVRVGAGSGYGSTALLDGADQVNGGTVQAAAATEAQGSAAAAPSASGTATDASGITTPWVWSDFSGYSTGASSYTGLAAGID